MANTYQTTGLVMTLPTVSVRVGPTYAHDINAALEAVAAHDHTTDKGERVPTAGIDIDADLSFGTSYSAKDVKSIRLASQAGAFSSSTTGALYSVGGDLYWNSGAGAPVKITDSATLNTAALVTNGYATTVLASDVTIAAGDEYALYLVDTSAARAITLPSAATVGRGRYYIFKDATGDASTNAIALARAGSDTIEGASSYTIAEPFGTVTLVSDGTSAWRVVAGAVTRAVAGTLAFPASAAAVSIAHHDKASGAAGAFAIVAQSSSDGNGGALTISAGSGVGASTAGGGVTIAAGDGGLNGGGVQINSGSGATGYPGVIDFGIGASASSSAYRMLRLSYDAIGGGGRYAILGDGAPPDLFGDATDTPSMFFTNAGAVPNRTAFSPSDGFLLTSVSGAPYFTLGNGAQFAVTNVTAAGVGGTNTHKLTFIVNGATYYVPLYTA